MFTLFRLALLLCACAAIPSFAGGVDPFPLSMHGNWEGQLRMQNFDGGQRLAKGAGEKQDFLLDIGKGKIVSHARRADGSFDESKWFSEFDYTSTADSLSGYRFHTGSDNGVTWEEWHSLIVHKVDENAIAIYWLRTVNNIAATPNGATSKWAVVWTGQLRRAAPKLP